VDRIPVSRRTFLAGIGAVGLLGARKRDAAWHHEHGPNGLALASKAPIDLTIPLLDGTTFRTADQRGRVVVINAFASWCGPCNEETPDLRAFAAAHADDTTVIGVDLGDDADKARAFAHANSLPYPLAADPANALYTRLGMTAYPTTIILRPDGRLSCAFIGEMSRDRLEDERMYALASATTTAQTGH